MDWIDFKIFLKYLFDIGGIIKKASTWSWVCLILALVSALIINDAKLRLIITTIFLFIGGVIITGYLVYKSGEHRYWYRKKYGKISKEEINKIKQENNTFPLPKGRGIQ